MKELWRKYREQITYVFFGGMTTLVNMAAFYLFDKTGMEILLSTGIAWVLSVLFAYGTNRRFVFASSASGFIPVLREMGGFFLCRALSGLLDMGIMYVFAEKMGLPGMGVKIASNVFVIIVNYIASKLWIFRKQ